MISVKQNKEQEKTARSRRKCVQCETGQLEGWRKVREKKEREKKDMLHRADLGKQKVNAFSVKKDKYK